jgi:hypothetical protein
MQQTKIWKRFRAHCLVKHLIRCHEVTFGENGWHPHVHVLMFALLPEGVSDWQDVLTACWQDCVCAVMGDNYVPSVAHGLDLSACDDGSYVAKMGLELSGAMSKEGRNGHMTAWQVGREVADGRMNPERWREYAEGMNGCHQLQWSRGLRDAWGEPVDDAVYNPDNEFEPSSTLADIPRETWKGMTGVRGALAELRRVGRTFEGSGEESRSWLLSFFERFGGGAEAEWRWRDGVAKLRWRNDDDVNDVVNQNP